MPSLQKCRPEAEIFADLAQVCGEPGFAHVVAFFCLRDNTIASGPTLTVEDIQSSYSWDRLIRTEIATLIGLMLKAPIVLRPPEQSALRALSDRAKALLEELHAVLSSVVFAGITADEIVAGYNPLANASALREPIFYGGESAYHFQYRDLAQRKYCSDSSWLLANKDFAIAQACSVFRGLEEVPTRKLNTYFRSHQQSAPEPEAMLDAFTFSLSEVANSCELEKERVKAVVEAFVAPADNRNPTFNALNDFNLFNAYPILRAGDEGYINFQIYSLYEALYETPFFWMNDDANYREIASRHRGSFSESFCYERLCRVFTKGRVSKNVVIRDSHGQDISEIDVLVKFAKIGVLIQAKSKRLTLEARKGNDGVLKSDFQKSVQSSYDQGLLCAQELVKGKNRWFDQEGKEITTKFDRIVILCVVSDHYPALAFQCHQLLKQTTTPTISSPFVMDVFTLDILTEFLNTPLYFLDYITKRTMYFDKLSISHELTALSYHLKRNLWLEDKFDFVHLADDFSSELDVAMYVRRQGLPGDATPKGLLTRFADDAIGRFIRQIEKLEHPSTVNLGLLLLSLSESALEDLGKALEHLASQARIDHKVHDVTLWFDRLSTGLTLHVNDDAQEDAHARLVGHCELRKYVQRASHWFGACVWSRDLTPRFGCELNCPWVHDAESEKNYSSITLAEPARSLRAALRKQPRTGRNQRCPCGSGKKYKRCCLGRG